MSNSSSASVEHKDISSLRLETARLRRGLTQAALAKELGITSRTYRSYEKLGAPFERRDHLARILDYPPEFFTVDEELDKIDPSEVEFRAGKRAPNKAKRAAVAVGRCGLEVDAHIQERFVLPTLDLPDLTDHTPREAARLLRDEWRLGDAPLPNLIQLCEAHGIRIYGLPPSAYAVDAFCHWSDGTPFIFIARRRTPEGVRFDIAHELGHLVMHSQSTPQPEHETEADEFASEFTTPLTALAKHIPAYPRLEDIIRVRTGYRVSAMSVAVAAHRADRMTDSTYRRMCTALGKKGFRTSEPGGMASYERSRVFDTVLDPRSRGSISERGIADQLHIPLDDVYALTLSTRLHAAATNVRLPKTRTSPREDTKLRLVHS
ncbi:ImmA/IrrE family metallo-endopeptidase [Corynebacterium variabile]|uniref:ImmA/IrrE family metallo-endopeptidase n=1 Tax=Corynebacterium variabile TaxID=1727 RepID=UPI003A93C5CA